MDPEVVATDEGEEAEAPRTSPGKVTIDTVKLKQRYDQLKSLRSNVEHVWDEIECYCDPMGSGGQPSTQATEGSVAWKRPEVWDSTAIESSEKLAAHIHGSVTSPAIRWFKLQWRDEELKNDKDASTWLEGVGDDVFDALTDSDFNTEISASDGDLVRYGNTFVVEEVANEVKWGGLDFETIPVREGYFEPDSKGMIETFYRKLSWSTVQIVDKCEAKGWTAPKAILEKAESGKNLGERLEVVFCVFAREEREEREGKKMVYPAAPHLRPYGYVYFLAETGERIGEEGGYYGMPVMLARWAKTAGSMWGHGPCHLLLPTIKYVNAWMETEKAAGEKAVDPSYGVTEMGILSDLDNRPGGVTVFRSKDDVWVQESKARFDVSQHTIEELRGMIRRGLHNDELQLKDSPAMTATEVQARYELMNRVLGSTLARIENDLLSPIVHMTIGHLMRANMLSPMPPAVQKKYAESEAEFQIEYQGPLARSQRTDEVAAIERVLAFAGALLKMGYPLKLVMAVINAVEGIRDVARRLGTPSNLLKPEEEAEQVLKEMTDLAARMEAAAAAKAEGEAKGIHADANARMGETMAARGGAGGGAPPPGAAPGRMNGAQLQPTPATPTPLVGPPFQPTMPLGPGSPPQP